MLRSLYTASSGMIAQQSHLDTIANNLANVNTTGFKKNRINFQDLLYQQTKLPTEEKPIHVEIGTGVMVASTLVDFQQGIIQPTGNSLDMAIDGAGFFRILMPNGEVGYTRNGAFRMDSQGVIVNSEGYRVLDENNAFLTLPANMREVEISANGGISAIIDGQDAPEEVGVLGLTIFRNSTGLEKRGGSIYLPTAASGDPQNGVANDVGFGEIRNYFLENSNVSVVEEMVNMITAQRAYEINTKAIQTSDEILQMTNNLRR